MDGDYAAGRDAPPDELGPGLLTGSAAFLDGALANPRLEAEQAARGEIGHHIVVEDC